MIKKKNVKNIKHQCPLMSLVSKLTDRNQFTTTEEERKQKILTFKGFGNWSLCNWFVWCSLF